ncbi:MAG: ATP-binding protein [Pseudomonadota bacterium]|nr:ATP-binding protein [Pseudomonadota bacterium]
MTLVLAVVAASKEPLVLLDGKLAVIAASASFCVAFHLDPAKIHGRHISELGEGEWNVPQLIVLLEATASDAAEVHAYELSLVRPGQATRSLVLNAVRLAYEDKLHTRLLLAVADVTTARANEKRKDDLIKQQAVLLQEVQHRVANSLQIIASILMQSARKVQSNESKGHLSDAHGRLMSIAAVQRQLAASKSDEVVLRIYLSQLSASLGASMIHDKELISIEVLVDDSKVSGQDSMSLGLIVTELVINALKYAFPDRREGKVTVAYNSTGKDWTLSVTDNGVGMPANPADATPGLGTNIVAALATSLEAQVQLTNAYPGTVVSIVHDHLAVAPIVRAA